MSHKHVPQRTCVICREKKEKRVLTRFVSNGQGVFPDPTGKANGRGAYICDQPPCWERARQTGQLGKALRVTLTDDDRQRIRDVQP